MNENLQKIINKLKKNDKTLTNLYLFNNNLCVIDFKNIAKALEKNNTLTTLSITGNNKSDYYMCSKGAKHILKSLEKNKTLKTLFLNYNYIDYDGAKCVAKALEKNNTLISLHLSYNNICDKGLRDIAKSLEKNKTLETLNLMGNYIHDIGTECMAKALKMNNTLTSLNLLDNYIGNEGCKFIAKALEMNETLTILHLWGNDIDTKGVKYIVKALEKNKTLHTISLRDKKIKDNFTNKIQEYIQRNRKPAEVKIFLTAASIINGIKKSKDKKVNKSLADLSPDSKVEIISYLSPSHLNTQKSVNEGLYNVYKWLTLRNQKNSNNRSPKRFKAIIESLNPSKKIVVSSCNLIINRTKPNSYKSKKNKRSCTIL